MTIQRHRELLDKINAIRNDTQTQTDGDCRTSVYNLCEIVGELLCELKNVKEIAISASYAINRYDNP